MRSLGNSLNGVVKLAQEPGFGRFDPPPILSAMFLDLLIGLLENCNRIIDPNDAIAHEPCSVESSLRGQAR